MIGLFIGRFQPFHNGHLHAIKQILKECDKVIIGIGSANSEITEQNPLNSIKRKELIEKVMQSENITNCQIVLINDQETHQLWADEVRKKANPFDILYVSGENIRLDFIKSCGFEVKEVDFLNGISATKIRELKKNNEPWKHFVPSIVAQDFS